MDQKKLIKRTASMTLSAALLFAMVFAVWRKAGFEASEKTPDYGKVILFGDSQFAHGWNEDSIGKRLEGLLGEKVSDFSLGGTGMAYTENDKRLAYTKGSFNMAGLSGSILTGDFRVQRETMILEPATGYFGERIELLENMDLKSVRLILIQHAVNDYHSGVPLENEKDAYDPFSYAGALRLTVKRLKSVNADCRIILVSPTYTWYPNQHLTCEEYRINGHILEDFVTKQEELSKELGLEFIDLYHDLYRHDSWEDMAGYTYDGLHPMWTARALIAERIAEYLKEYH